MIAEVIGRGRELALFLMLRIGRGLGGAFRLIFAMFRHPFTPLRKSHRFLDFRSHEGAGEGAESINAVLLRGVQLPISNSCNILCRFFVILQGQRKDYTILRGAVWKRSWNT